MNFKQYHYPQGIPLRYVYESLNCGRIYHNLQNRDKNLPSLTPTGKSHITNEVCCRCFNVNGLICQLKMQVKLVVTALTLYPVEKKQHRGARGTT